jgi:demethylspheroidene O-methyltransferase
VKAYAQRAHDGRDTARPAVSSPIAERLLAFRDRLLASRRFQQFSASFPPSRPIAHKQARALFDLCAGFVYSQILAACVELDLFRKLRAAPKTLDGLARDVNVPAERLSRLLDAAVSLRLLSRRSGNRYGLGMLGAALVGDSGIGAMIQHHAMLYRDLQDPVALLRGVDRPRELARFWGYAGSNNFAALDDDAVAAYTDLMARSQSFIANDVLDAYQFDRHTCLLDVGGGDGAFVAAAAAKYPSLKFKLFDLPAVAARAQNRMAAVGLSERVAVYGGSFRNQSLPRGADLISLVRVLHDHDDPVAVELLRAAHDALPRGGCVLIAEPMAGVAGAAHVGTAYFGVYLLAMGSGRARTAQEIFTMLDGGGFKRANTLRTRQPMLVGAIVAFK